MVNYSSKRAAIRDANYSMLARSLAARNNAKRPLPEPREIGLAHHAVKVLRQKSVNAGIALGGNRPQIGTGRSEYVGLADHHPRAVVIQSKAALGFWWNFKRILGRMRRRVRDRNRKDADFAIFLGKRQQNRSGTVFAAFFEPALMLVGPEIGVFDDHAGRWGSRYIHGLTASVPVPAFGDLGIELRRVRGRFSRFKRRNEFLGVSSARHTWRSRRLKRLYSSADITTSESRRGG